MLCSLFLVRGRYGNIRNNEREYMNLSKSFSVSGLSEVDLNETVRNRFGYVVETFTERVALTDGNVSYTYGDLDAITNQIGLALGCMGVRTGDFVSVFIPRSIETVLGLWGVMKAGAVYVPLDPSHPVSRNEFIIENSDSRVVLSVRSMKDQIDSLGCLDRVVYVEDVLEGVYARHVGMRDREDVLVTVEDNLYMIYTSGTTGTPKGAVLGQKGVLNLVGWMNNVWGLDERDVVLQFATFSFDASVIDTFGALLTGATLFVLPNESRLSVESFLDDVDRMGVTVVPVLPTVFFNQLVEYALTNGVGMGTIRVLGVGGELLKGELARKMRSNDLLREVRLFNLYGPTETTVAVTAHEVFEVGEETFGIPIGSALPNTSLYVLDDFGNEVVAGDVGELCVSTVGMFKGYLKNESKTSEVLIPNMYGDGFGDALYRTGDLVREVSSGVYEFVDRKDLQVKIRGHRIEIAEIESRLGALEGVSEAIVVVDTSENEKRLKAFYTCVGSFEPNEADMVAALKTVLPSYMVPVMWKRVDAIPMTPTGKADRKLLATMVAERVSVVTDYVSPRNEMEMEVLSAWEEVLGFSKDSVGVTDDFFEVGGHSLKIISVLARLKKTTPRIGISDFFELRTVEKISDKMLNLVKEDASVVIEDAPFIRKERESFVDLRELPYLPVAKRSYEVETVLVTGVTGYLGSHVAREALDRGKRVLAVVRGENDDMAIERVRDVMRGYFGKDVDLSGMNVFAGDLTKRYFGWTRESFELTSQGIDAIVHTAADVRHFGERESFLASNVTATENVMEMMEYGEMVLHHISTVGVIEDMFNEGKWPDAITRDLGMLEGFNLTNGYTDTKRMAEVSVLNQIEAGKDVYVYRMANLTGRYSDGLFQRNMESNAFYRMMKLMMGLGYAPRLNWMVDFTPIDYAARVVMDGVLKDTERLRVSHVASTDPISWIDLVEMLNTNGYSIELLDVSDFNARLMSDGLSVELAELSVAQMDGDGATDSEIVYASEWTMYTLGVDRISITSDYVERLVGDMARRGFLV